MLINPFQGLIIIIGVLLFFIVLDAYKRKGMNFIHFLTFFLGITLIIIFIFNSDLLNYFGEIFGLQKGADLIVYISIIFLVYLYFEILHKITKQDIKNTKIIRKISIDNSKGDISSSKTVFVIPAYNEGDIVINVIDSILNKGYGVVFIDDGSDNLTFEKVNSNFQSRENLLLIKHFENMGQGAALQTGFDAIEEYGKNCKYIVTFDSDGQHRIEDLENFINEFKKDKNLDIVLGSRFLGDTINMPKSKWITLKAGIIFTFILSGIKLTDTHNGYRVIKKESLNKINISMNGMEHASEILDIIKKKKLNYKEVPIVVDYTDYSLNKGQKISNSLKIVFKLIYKKFFFR